MLDRKTNDLSLKDIDEPEVVRGSALVEMEATSLLSYTRSYIDGKLDSEYMYPDKPHIPGVNGVGVVRKIGSGVYHLRVGQRVLVDPFLTANECVFDPAMVLIGHTSIGANSKSLMNDWADGTWAELVCFPAASLYPTDGLESFSDVDLAAFTKFAVPYGALRRANLAPGQTLIVNGATGYFGSAALILALAMGVERVVAVGRSKAKLERLATTIGGSVIPVAMEGNIENDVKALREATKGGAHVVLDMIGGASSADSTLACIKALRRGGTSVLTGSLTVPLPLNYAEMLNNNLVVRGSFMYTENDALTLLGLLRSGRIDLSKMKTRSFAMKDLHEGIDAASRASGLDNTVLLLK